MNLSINGQQQSLFLLITQHEFKKSGLVKYIIPRSEKNNGPRSNFEKGFHLFLIVIFSCSITLAMIFLIFPLSPLAFFTISGNYYFVELGKLA